MPGDETARVDPEVDRWLVLPVRRAVDIVSAITESQGLGPVELDHDRTDADADRICNRWCAERRSSLAMEWSSEEF